MAGTNVPGIDSTPTFSQSVPGIELPRRGEFGQVGRAYEELGRVGEQGAQEGANIYDEIARQHDITTASQAALNTESDQNLAVQNLKQTSPDGFIHDPDTKEIVQNADGSQRTIAQEYADNAEDYAKNAEKDLTPRAASIYREKIMDRIGANTKYLQNEGLVKQNEYAEVAAENMKDTMKRDFNTSFVPTGNQGEPYYTAPGENGSTKEYPSQQKFFNAVQTMQLYRQQKGPINGAPGAYDPVTLQGHIRKDSDDLANSWLETAVDDLLRTDGSRGALHSQLKDASSTSSMQVRNLLDIVNGKDPQSQQRASDSGNTGLALPTVNTSLTPENIHKWNDKLLALFPTAKDQDRHEFNLQKEMLAMSAKGTTDFGQWAKSDLFTKTVMMSQGLGDEPAETVGHVAPAAAEALASAAISKTGAIASPDAKIAAINNEVKTGANHMVLAFNGMGEHMTGGFANALAAEASRQASAKVQEDINRMHTDPNAYAAEVKSGPQGPGGQIQYKSAMANNIHTVLDPNNKGASMLDIFKPMSNGKSVLAYAQLDSGSTYQKIYGHSGTQPILSDEDFKNQAKWFEQMRDPKLMTQYFNQLDQEKGLNDAQKEAFEKNLVEKGGLKQTYSDALNLKTPAEREVRWADLLAGPPPFPEGVTKKDVEEASAQNNKGITAFLYRKYGANSPMATTASKTYDEAWQGDYLRALNRNMSATEAAGFANTMRDKTTSSVGVAAKPGRFFGTSGPSVPVEFGGNFNIDQQKNITDVLTHRQQSEYLSKYSLAVAPGSLPPNENAPTSSDEIAQNASMWRRVGGGWNLQVQTTDKENRPTGNSVDVNVRNKQGRLAPFFVPESEALSGMPKPGEFSMDAKKSDMEPKL